MIAAFAPIKTGSAYGASLCFESGDIKTKSGEEGATSQRHAWGIFGLKKSMVDEKLKELHTPLTSQMIVAQACRPKRGVPRTGAHWNSSGALRKAHQRLKHLRNIGARQLNVTVATLLLKPDEFGLAQFCQMAASSLDSDTCRLGKLGHGQCATIHQGDEHVGAGWIANKRCNARDHWTIVHSSVLAEALPQGNVLVAHAHQSKGLFTVITCFIRYEIDAFKVDAFKEYARNWGAAIPQCGADLIGYYAPYEGSSTTAYGVYNIADLAAYEQYRARLRANPIGQANYEFAKREQFIRREDRMFLRLASAPHAKLAKP